MSSSLSRESVRMASETDDEASADDTTDDITDDMTDDTAPEVDGTRADNDDPGLRRAPSPSVLAPASS